MPGDELDEIVSPSKDEFGRPTANPRGARRFSL